MTTETTPSLNAGTPPQRPLPGSSGIDAGQAESLHKDAQLLPEKICHAARTAQAYGRSNPWKTAGLMAAAGVILGVLIRRR
ncbi:MAG: hypothetical protein WBH99_05030 [Azovibrio sp.]|uniref:glycine zipper domain-containing protein n=1 Tax=Azovibrio sp. TaxID=1872673 RepID=UPI003C746D72